VALKKKDVLQDQMALEKCSWPTFSAIYWLLQLYNIIKSFKRKSEMVVRKGEKWVSKGFIYRNNTGYCITGEHVPILNQSLDNNEKLLFSRKHLSAYHHCDALRAIYCPRL
jgi:hypothetical protein